jgi:hypothetical protein
MVGLASMMPCWQCDCGRFGANMNFLKGDQFVVVIYVTICVGQKSPIFPGVKALIFILVLSAAVTRVLFIPNWAR